MVDPSDRDLLDLETRFDGAMFEIYERAGREVGYWATRYLQMLRARGGLETARRLLKAKTTSDGYAHLRDSARLDLTVEAYALRPEFQPLFSTAELNMARSRLEYFGRPLEMPTMGGPVDPELLSLVAAAAAAPPEGRVEYRDGVAAFGPSAIPVMEAWAAEGRSVGFASMVLEVVGRSDGSGGAVQALRRLRARHADWAAVIEAAIARIGAEHPLRPRVASSRSDGDGYVAAGAPPPALGPCGVPNHDGSACRNPGRHQLGKVLSCTTHYKAATRNRDV